MLKRLVPWLVFAAGLLVLDLALPRYARGHFIPETTVREASRTPSDVWLLGNSLMAAGYAPAGRLQKTPTIANISIGATAPVEHFLILRRMLETSKPRVLVYGWFGPQLVEDSVRMDDLQGNRLLTALWSTPADIPLIFGAPEEQPAEVTRFLLMNTVPLAGYGPLVQGRVEVTRRSWAERGGHAANPFGADDDFRRLADASWKGLEGKLASHRTGSGFAFSRDVVAMHDLAHARGIGVMWIAMPIVSSARATAAGSAAYADYVAAAKRDLVSSGDWFLDATALEGIDDSAYRDGLHLNDHGAEVFTRWLESQLVEALR